MNILYNNKTNELAINVASDAALICAMNDEHIKT